MNNIEKKIRVFIVDDHQLIRDGLIALLAESDSIEIVGDASSGEEAINMLDRAKPDVILMDLIMHGMSGLEATRWLKETNSGCKVILVTMEVNKEHLATGIRCCIDGYLPKNSPRKFLLDAIAQVYNGGKFFPEPLKKMIFDDFAFRERFNAPEKPRLPNDLTRREYEILGHVVDGKSNGEIAEELFISVKTVDTHKTHILEKLQVRNIAELVIYAVKHGIVSI
jgi:DNA-binding NarL/FixJ family response regulator